ncbi:hypothetical protein, partial [Enterococcus casseliflavus]|uniref:hypothetical protein n=1 Tax=Enterococcus casseliflavus TaxID=37734 RepID=UPI003D115EBC
TSSATNFQIASVDLNGAGSRQADIETVIRNTLGIRVQSDTAFLCYTPLGRVYFVEGSTPNFDSQMPMVGAIEILLRRR